jgi:hypothetical protein
VSGSASWTGAEHVELEGRNGPEGEWRRRERQAPTGKDPATGPRRRSSRGWGEPVAVVEPKGRTGRGEAGRGSEEVGRER